MVPRDFLIMIFYCLVINIRYVLLLITHVDCLKAVHNFFSSLY